MKIFLNLLPPERKAQLVKRFYWRYFLGQWFLVFLVTLLVLGAMIGFSFQAQLEGNQQEKIKADLLTGEHQQEYQRYEEKFEEGNRIVRSANAFLTLHTSFSYLLSQLEESLPENTKIDKISTQSYQVFVIGNTDTRDTFLRFQENIKNNTCFEAVNTPLSNLFSETNVQFEIDFIVKPECLRGSVPKL